MKREKINRKKKNLFNDIVNWTKRNKEFFLAQSVRIQGDKDVFSEYVWGIFGFLYRKKHFLRLVFHFMVI